MTFNNWVYTLIPIIDKEINWLAIISGLVFLIFVIATLWDLSRQLEISEDERPEISVKEQLPGEMWNLEITNKGERGIFSAEIALFNNENTIGDWYHALWSQQNSNMADLMNGQRDIIILASISHTDDRKSYFDIKSYNTLSKRPEVIRHIELDENGLSNDYQQLIQVKITSTPRSRNGTILKEYILHTGGMKFIKKPKQRNAEYGHYFLGADSDVIKCYSNLEVMPTVN